MTVLIKLVCVKFYSRFFVTPVKIELIQMKLIFVERF